jgi:hypothetical protein
LASNFAIGIDDFTLAVAYRRLGPDIPTRGVGVARWSKMNSIKLTTFSGPRSNLMLDPTPELPDDTLLSRVDFSTRIQNVLSAAGLRTVGEVRESPDDMLLSLPDLGKASVDHLRKTLGLPSSDGVRPR